MEIKFFTQNIKLGLRTEGLIREKLGKVIRLAGYKKKDVRDVRVDLSRKPGHGREEKVRLEVNINLYPGQIILRAAERASDLHNALDKVEKILKRQMGKYKGRSKARALRGARYVKHVGGTTEQAFEKGKPKFGKRRREE